MKTGSVAAWCHLIPSRVAKNSVYEYLEGQLGLDISYATKDMRAEIVSELGLELMKLTPMDCY